jgi:hypothetical protein
MDGKGKRTQAKLPVKTDAWNNRSRQVSAFMASFYLKTTTRIASLPDSQRH